MTRQQPEGVEPMALGSPHPFTPHTLAEDETPRELDGSPTERSATPAANLAADQLLAEEQLLVQRARLSFAWALVALVTLGGGALMVGAFVVSDDQWQRLERVGVLIVVPLLTLLGSAIGWYYGGQKGGAAR